MQKSPLPEHWFGPVANGRHSRAKQTSRSTLSWQHSLSVSQYSPAKLQSLLPPKLESTRHWLPSHNSPEQQSKSTTQLSRNSPHCVTVLSRQVVPSHSSPVQQSPLTIQLSPAKPHWLIIGTWLIEDVMTQRPAKQSATPQQSPSKLHLAPRSRQTPLLIMKLLL